MSVSQRRPSFTDEEVEAIQRRQNELACLVGYHLVEALDAAQRLHGDAYAYEYTSGTMLDIWHEYQVLTDTVPQPDPRKRKEIGARLRRTIMERDEYRCVECGTHLDLTLDHIIPVVRGGENTVENLRVLCQSCNSKKGTRV